MKRVTGARLGDAEFGDFQRLFKCEPNSLDGVPSTGCPIEDLEFPMSCSFPPCNVCYKGPWMFGSCYEHRYTIDGYNVFPNPPQSFTEESASECQRTCQMDVNGCKFFTYYEGNNSCTTKTANALAGLRHVEGDAGLTSVVGPQHCPPGKSLK